MAGNRIAVTIAAIASAFVLAACGADDETDTETEVLTDEDTVTETATETEVETQTETTQPGDGAANGGDGADGPSGVRGCGDVAFRQNTDNGAFDIRARNVGCQVARAVARNSEGAGRRYDSRGFTCWGDPRGGELPSTQFDCKRGNQGIEFSRS